jgi:hypothetical protein
LSSDLGTTLEFERLIIDATSNNKADLQTRFSLSMLAAPILTDVTATAL